jgi:hypothetical protein
MKSIKLYVVIVLITVVSLVISSVALGAWWERDYLVPPGIVRSGSCGPFSGGLVNRHTNTYASLGNAMIGSYGLSKQEAHEAGRVLARMTGLSRGALYNVNYTHWALLLGNTSGSK